MSPFADLDALMPSTSNKFDAGSEGNHFPRSALQMLRPLSEFMSAVRFSSSSIVKSLMGRSTSDDCFESIGFLPGGTNV